MAEVVEGAAAVPAGRLTWQGRRNDPAARDARAVQHSNTRICQSSITVGCGDATVDAHAGQLFRVCLVGCGSMSNSAHGPSLQLYAQLVSTARQGVTAPSPDTMPLCVVHQAPDSFAQSAAAACCSRAPAVLRSALAQSSPAAVT